MRSIATDTNGFPEPGGMGSMLIRGARVVTPGRDLGVAGVRIDGGRIVAVVAARVALMNAADYHKPVFLAGDFNFEVGARPIATLMQGMSILNDPAAKTFPADKPKKCIDFIMVDAPHADRVKVTERQVVGDAAASDHRAVVVKAEL